MRVELKEEDPFLIERLLRYCYMLAWSESKMPGEQQWISRYSTVVMMYAIGDKYDIRGLKQESERRFAVCLREMEWSVIQIDYFLQAVSLVYTMTSDCDRGLRDQAAVFGRENWGRFCLVPDFKDNLSRYYDFVSDIITERGAPSEEGKTCISCDSSLFYGYHYCVDCGEVYEDSRE